MTEPGRHKEIYYLESIARNLTEFASMTGKYAPSIGTEVLNDNREWLDDHISKLRAANRPLQEQI